MPESPQIPLAAIHWCEPIPNDDRDPVRRWQAHLDAGRIGANPPTPPRRRSEPKRHRRALPHFPQPPPPGSPRMTRPLEHPLTPDTDATGSTADEAFPSDLPNDFDVGEAIAPRLLASRRGDGWTADRQRAFCDAIATGATVESAARAVGLSTSSAYAFRNSARGAAFAIGWNAASLIQRQRLSDIVLSRAFCGQTVTVSRASGETVERHFYDNRLTMAVLTRLDRLAAGVAPGQASGRAGADPIGAAQAQEHAARLAAGEWDRYLDLLANDATPAQAGLFLSQRSVGAAPAAPELAAITALARADLYDRTRAGVPAELDVSDLDVAHRAGWTAEQWARAEAVGLLTIAAPEQQPETHDSSPPESQHSDDFGDNIWWDYDRREWRTAFPPPEDFDGDEFGERDDVEYKRTLSDEETALMGVGPDRYEDWELAERAAQRDAWFAALAGETPPEHDTPRRPGEGRDRCVTEAEPSPQTEPEPDSATLRHPGESRDLPVAQTKPRKPRRRKAKTPRTSGISALPTPAPLPLALVAEPAA